MNWREKDRVRKLEWRRIPDHPDYEVNQRGDVRFVTSGVELTSTRLDYQYWYALQLDGNVYSYEVMDLIKMTFPELSEEIEHRDRVSTEFKPNFVQEDLDATPSEWRVIPYADQYEINQYGMIRNRTTLRFRHSKAVFTHIDDTGKLQQDPIWRIMKEVWPETLYD